MDTKSSESGAGREKEFIGETSESADRGERPSKGRRRFLIGALQSAVCLAIIGAIIFMKFASPGTFASVSSSVSGLYEKNVTLADLDRLLNEKLLNGGALSAFFNMPASEGSDNG